MNLNDTIVAPATSLGKCSIGIIRISGKNTCLVAKLILKKIPKPRYAEYLPFLDKNNLPIDIGIAIFFKKPNSLTGEDVLELQGHGNPIVMDLIIKRILSLPNIRIAKPGEFLKRAFLNKKIDLIQAEAISDLINASSINSVKLSINSLKGIFSKKINKIIKLIINLRTYIESYIDFSEEDIKFLTYKKIKKKINIIIKIIIDIQNESIKNNILKEGKNIVITGKPNAGKSSLLNALFNENIAIVSSIKGTTRDIISKKLYINGVPINIIDSAGLRKINEFNKFNKLEKIGINKAWCEIKNADHILYVVDITKYKKINPNILLKKFLKKINNNIPITIIRNKSDILNKKPSIKKINNYYIITLSSYKKKGINILYKYFKKIIININNTEGIYLARRRHLDALKNTYLHLLKCLLILKKKENIDLLAEELKLSHKYLNMITGKFNTNKLLKNIFKNFCIGK